MAPAAQLLKSRWPLIALFLIAFCVLWPYRNFAGDDAYITFRFARNLANGAGYAFNPGEPTYGSTAPLWVLLIAALHRLGVDVADASHALNWIFAGAFLASFFAVSGHFLRSLGAQFVAALLLALNPWFVRWALSGMENNLALFLLTIAMFHQLKWRSSDRFYWVPAVEAGLLTLCRPEGAIFAVVLLLDSALHGPRRFARLATGAACYAAVLVPWLWFAHQHLGTIIPNTVLAKVGRGYMDPLVRTAKFFGTFWPFHALALGAVGLLLRRELRHSVADPAFRGRWFLPCAWGLALPAFYLAGRAPVSGRYLALALPSYVLVGSRAVEILFDRGRAGDRASVAAWFRATSIGSTLATIALVAFVQYKYCWYITAWPDGMDPRLIEVAKYVRAHSSPGDTIGADQIGVIGYVSDRRVLDIFGLVSPEILPHRRASVGAMWRYVRERAPEFLFVVHKASTLEKSAAGYDSLELLQTVAVRREGANDSESPITYRLYRTNW